MNNAGNFSLSPSSNEIFCSQDEIIPNNLIETLWNTWHIPILKIDQTIWKTFTQQLSAAARAPAPTPAPPPTHPTHPPTSATKNNPYLPSTNASLIFLSYNSDTIVSTIVLFWLINMRCYFAFHINILICVIKDGRIRRLCL